MLFDFEDFDLFVVFDSVCRFYMFCVRMDGSISNCLLQVGLKCVLIYFIFLSLFGQMDV